MAYFYFSKLSGKYPKTRATNVPKKKGDRNVKGGDFGRLLSQEGDLLNRTPSESPQWGGWVGEGALLNPSPNEASILREGFPTTSHDRCNYPLYILAPLCLISVHSTPSWFLSVEPFWIFSSGWCHNLTRLLPWKCFEKIWTKDAPTFYHTAGWQFNAPRLSILCTNIAHLQQLYSQPPTTVLTTGITRTLKLDISNTNILVLTTSNNCTHNLYNTNPQVASFTALKTTRANCYRKVRE